LFITATVAAQQPAAKPAAQPGFRPVATVKDIMELIVSPASKTVFEAVKSEVTASGVVEKAPKDDKEWDEVRAQALLMVEASNLLMMPGRHITEDSSSPNAQTTAGKGEEYELTPRQIELLVAKERTAWLRFARAFNVAAGTALKAATAKNAQELQATGEAVDNACENCHLKFWYPDQEKLLSDAAARNRKK
jgi:hypothetical protein